jgi:3-deoxy-D-manno-octulosonic-acid transferase
MSVFSRRVGKRPVSPNCSQRQAILLLRLFPVVKGLPILPLYQALSASFAPLSPAVLYFRRKWRGEDDDRIGEKFGWPSMARPQGPLAWLHGASVGESLALLPLIEKLAARGLNILLSTGTSSAAAVIAPRLPAGSLHQFLPLDVPQFLARFLGHWRPNLALVAESEIWPNLFVEIRRREIPLILVNARISQGAFRRWRWLPYFIETLLEGVDLCLAQTEADAERFAKLGIKHVKVVGNLKYDVLAPPADRRALAALAGRIGARPLFLATSTHRGEEEIVMAVHQALQQRIPGLLTIIVPRRARRGDEIAALAAERGLAVLQRSRETEDDPLPALYIADTTGELGLFYRLASVAFIGRSFIRPGGGQNPIEAAKLGCAILHGPHVDNFAEVYRVLDETRGAATVADADTLARVIALLLTDTGKLRKMARSAGETVERLGGASTAIMAAIEPHVVQLIVERRRWEA